MSTINPRASFEKYNAIETRGVTATQNEEDGAS